jgi:hypothetical protein
MIAFVDYDTVAAIYMAPVEEGMLAPSVRDSPARRLRDALEPIAGTNRKASPDDRWSVASGF